LERHALARPFLERGAIGVDRLLELRRAALALAKCPKREAKVVLRRRPVERHALARPFLERGAVGVDRLLESRRAALARTKCLKRVAEFILRLSPLARLRSASLSFALRRFTAPSPTVLRFPPRLIRRLTHQVVGYRIAAIGEPVGGVFRHHRAPVSRAYIVTSQSKM
jgi:hypothetical protein